VTGVHLEMSSCFFVPYIEISVLKIDWQIIPDIKCRKIKERGKVHE
jgi:hypothetical protein